MTVIVGIKTHKCESSDDGFHDLEVIEISELQQRNAVYVLLQCSWCKQSYDGNIRKVKGS